MDSLFKKKMSKNVVITQTFIEIYKDLVKTFFDIFLFPLQTLVMLHNLNGFFDENRMSKKVVKSVNY